MVFELVLSDSLPQRVRLSSPCPATSSWGRQRVPAHLEVSTSTTIPLPGTEYVKLG
jgi:hypothetical protein